LTGTINRRVCSVDNLPTTNNAISLKILENFKNRYEILMAYDPLNTFHPQKTPNSKNPTLKFR
jgi:hypothetical protein